MAASPVTSAGDRGRSERKLLIGLLLPLAVGGVLLAQEPSADATAQGWTSALDFGGNVRLFAFALVEDLPGREHFEQSALRLTLEQELAPPSGNGAWEGVRVEAHGVLSGVSPIAVGFAGSGVTSSGALGHRRFDLETEVLQSTLQDDDVRLWAEIDRLNVRFEHRRFRLTLGRQAITWGVNYFWPVLDLFGPFSPSAVDRDYKPGVDAARLTLPLGDFSQIELIAAAQGEGATAAPDSDEDWSYSALGRFHLQGTDVGFLLGDFYRDEVAGAFVVGDLGGFGLRGEVLFNDVAEEWLGLPGESRSSFLRATAGIDRLLSPRASVVAELSFNGYGAESPADYPTVAVSDRVRRGEITSLGREYGGVSLSYQGGPLWTVAGALLVNWGDRSVLLQPSLMWSLSNNASALFGAFVGFGDEPDAEGAPRSEYGGVPVTVWAAVKTYF